jgi:CheY-like chemotaxis protein
MQSVKIRREKNHASQLMQKISLRFFLEKILMLHTYCILIVMRSILFVDDDEDDKLVFGTALNLIDKKIVYLTASDGHEALKLLKEDLVLLPDLIFLDLNMARMDGFTCLQKLKHTKELQQIPVVIMTTSINPRDKEKALTLGAENFITKPSTYTGLIDTLKSCL